MPRNTIRRSSGILFFTQVLRRTGLTVEKLRQKLIDGTFPKPSLMGVRTEVWSEDDIQNWHLKQLEKKRRQKNRKPKP